MTDSASLKPNESGGTKYVPPAAVRLKDSAKGLGSQCDPTGNSYVNIYCAPGIGAAYCYNGNAAHPCDEGNQAGYCGGGNGGGS